MARANQHFEVEVTTEYMVALFLADARKAGIKAKQRLEFLLVAECPAMRDTWGKMVAGHEANAPVYQDPLFMPHLSSSRLDPSLIRGIWAVRANHGHTELPGLTFEDTQFESPKCPICSMWPRA